MKSNDRRFYESPSRHWKSSLKSSWKGLKFHLLMVLLSQCATPPRLGVDTYTPVINLFILMGLRFEEKISKRAELKKSRSGTKKTSRPLISEDRNLSIFFLMSLGVEPSPLTIEVMVSMNRWDGLLFPHVVSISTCLPSEIPFCA